MTETSETRKQFTIVRRFKASPETVWQAWTDPEQAAQWWHPRGVRTPRDSVSIDLRVGGKYAYTMINEETGDEYPTVGTYLEVVEPNRLAFTWTEPGVSEDAPVIEIDLVEIEHGTEMRFKLTGHEGQPGDEWIYDGWSEAFDILTEQLPSP